MPEFENPYTLYGAFRVREPGGGVQRRRGRRPRPR